MEVRKGNLFCLERGHVVQSKVFLLLQEITAGTTECNKASLCVEGCPSLQCQRLESFVTDATLQVFTKPPELREDNLEMMSMIECGRVAKDVGCRM